MNFLFHSTLLAPSTLNFIFNYSMIVATLPDPTVLPPSSQIYRGRICSPFSFPLSLSLLPSRHQFIYFITLINLLYCTNSFLLSLLINLLHCTNQFPDILHAVFLHISGNPVNHFLRGTWIMEILCSYCHCCSAG